MSEEDVEDIGDEVDEGVHLYIFLAMRFDERGAGSLYQEFPSS